MPEEGVAFPRDTKFGVVGCLEYDKCQSNTDGFNCQSCTQNKYAKDKRFNFIIESSEAKKRILASLAQAVEKLTIEQMVGGNTLFFSVDIKTLEFKDFGMVDNLMEAEKHLKIAADHINKSGALLTEVTRAEIG